MAMTRFTRIGLVGGTGREGPGLALRFAQAGAHVVIGSRSAKRAGQTVEQIRALVSGARLEAADNAAAISTCEVVFLCVPFAHAAATVDAHRAAFQPGSLVVDVTVPVTFEGGPPRLIDLPEGSATEHLRRRLPQAVGLAAALKTIPARLLAELGTPLDCDDFVCGDSREVRQRASDVLRLIPGLRPIDAGPLEAARTLERMTLLAIGINRRYKIHDARFRLVGLPAVSS